MACLYCCFTAATDRAAGGNHYSKSCPKKQIYCVAPDLRGCGESEKANNGYAIEEQAEDIAAFVQAVNLRHFNLLAHSTSGPALSRPGSDADSRRFGAR